MRKLSLVVAFIVLAASVIASGETVMPLAGRSVCIVLDDGTQIVAAADEVHFSALRLVADRETQRTELWEQVRITISHRGGVAAVIKTPHAVVTPLPVHSEK